MRSEMHDRRIGLSDANNFFVSCERVVNPALNGRPVVVLSGNDGCIIARSNEVKALGVPMGAPYFKYNAVYSVGYKAHAALFTEKAHGRRNRRINALCQNLVSELLRCIAECLA